jgi:hypothetical protein
MIRHLVANLSVLALIVVAAVALAVRAEWEWWQVALAAVGAFFAGGLFVERVATAGSVRLRAASVTGRAPASHVFRNRAARAANSFG